MAASTRTKKINARKGKRRRKHTTASSEQLTFLRAWGHRRKGAGRKRSPHSGVSHQTREPLASRFPVHVTMKLRRGLPHLRRRAPYRALCHAFDRGKERAGRLERGRFRLVHYSVQNDHLHLIVEATDRLSLSRGIQGLSIRIARALNRLWQRAGRVFADRYHDHILRTPREIRNALAYLFHNAKKHLPSQRHRTSPDPFTTAPSFEGWRDHTPAAPNGTYLPTAPSHTWLLDKGWRRHGLLRLLPRPIRTP